MLTINNPKYSSITVDGKEVTVDGMFDELSKVMELQKKMNEVFKNSPLDPADFQGTQEQACFQIPDADFVDSFGDKNMSLTLQITYFV